MIIKRTEQGIGTATVETIDVPLMPVVFVFLGMWAMILLAGIIIRGTPTPRPAQVIEQQAPIPPAAVGDSLAELRAVINAALRKQDSLAQMQRRIREIMFMLEQLDTRHIVVSSLSEVYDGDTSKAWIVVVPNQVPGDFIFAPWLMAESVRVQWSWNP
jgi:hypothetical protein